MEQRHKIFNLIILDASGSMQSIKNTVISGFNELVDTIKDAGAKFPEQDHYVSLVVFNSTSTKTVLDRQTITQLFKLTPESYRPDNSTPLYDAIGESVNHLKSVIENKESYNVLVTIITDGEENSSKEYNLQAIKSLIDELKTTEKWTFTYIGANQNVEQVAQNMAIDNSLVFESNPDETKAMFSKERASRISYYSKISKKEDVSKGYFDEQQDV